MKRVAVTGSSGFVGKMLVKRLKQDGFEVIELDIAKGTDITDLSGLKNVPRFDVLIHLAAKTYVPGSYKDPHGFYYVNVNGTLNALELCRIYNARIIFASSYVYGVPQYMPIDEKHPLSAFNPYARSKIVGESLCEGYNRDFGVPATILRPFNIFGKGQNSLFLIPKIIEQAAEGKINLFDPEPKRDFVYIDDVIDAYIKAVQFENKELEVFNIGAGETFSVMEIAKFIADRFNCEEITYSDQKRKAEISVTLADISKAADKLKWKPAKGFFDRLEEMLK